jgi:hypothetical protein
MSAAVNGGGNSVVPSRPATISPEICIYPNMVADFFVF